MVCGFSHNENNSFPTRKPQHASSGRKQERRLHQTPLHLLPPSRHISPLQRLEAPGPTFDVYDERLDANYSSRYGMIQDAKDYTRALDFEGNEPLRVISSYTRDCTHGGATLQEPSSAASVLAPAAETVPAPGPAPEAPQATATGTFGYAMQPGVTRANTRSHVRSYAGTKYRENRNNREAFGRPLPEGHCSTGAQAKVSYNRTPHQFGHCAPSRPHAQHRECLSHHQYARKLFGG